MHSPVAVVHKAHVWVPILELRLVFQCTATLPISWKKILLGAFMIIPASNTVLDHRYHDLVCLTNKHGPQGGISWRTHPAWL